MINSLSLCLKTLSYVLTLDLSVIAVSLNQMSRAMRKRVLCYMRTTKAQISLRIRAFVVRCLDIIISLNSIAEISRL